ncbi:sigma-70 family RNA polymerase sigma factor [Gloeobacter kilaueensis]|uniref:ECF subfamily RNA polymerase sigma-24 factor n=1 Tax=Gloeobacter kilaueensis (strain ATCC BAA-2537 / CCAP 1431/1 / ULC 316 / JS1) TaxID=1183438 RepID=U5QKX5_GLOK1|nr:sigma-70 family RNA polymerase sigma factor [Gloeobacter kilaueensis]AGY59642.1 ECF subfamily RNA polymerase sigma-24 factor [Gloeobacter kilaueensis JS1]
MHSPANVTQLLLDWRNGDEQALAQLTPLIYRELHSLAERSLRSERGGHTLQATALVNEAYLRLLSQSEVPWSSRSHFLAIAARSMRRILIEHARRRNAAKRGGGAVKVSLEKVAELSSPERDEELVALDEALAVLETIDPQQSQIVELRYFGGLTIEQTAEALAISPATVKRHWSVARAWLYRWMSEASNDS